MSSRTAETAAPCAHERAHVVDSLFFGAGYGTAETQAIFCDLCRYRRWLAVEVALAESQAELGLIPGWAARVIADQARLERLDLDGVRTDIARTGHSLVPLLRALSAACGEAGEYVHFGATTQDIQDTAQSLEAMAVLDIVERDLRGILERLCILADRHRDTLMVGRTHGQIALPMTFGLKVASFVDELLRALDRLQECRARVSVAQLFGGVGTMAALGEAAVDLGSGEDGGGEDGGARPAQGEDVALRLLDRFSARLGLSAPRLAWHAARDRVAELVAFLGILSGSLARLADEIRSLCRPEIAEVSPGYGPDQVGSSTMPHKRNPEACEKVVVLARLVRSKVSLGLEAMLTEHERDGRTLRLEWPTVADAAHHTCAALGITLRVLDTLEVNEVAMAERARSQAAWMGSEALMLALARRVGKETAHRLVHRASSEAQRTGRSLLAVLAEGGAAPDGVLPETMGELEALVDPARHLGVSRLLADRVLAAAEERLRRPAEHGRGAAIAAIPATSPPA